MSLSDTRAAITAALTAVSDCTGYESRPKTTKPGDGWPQWGGSEPGDRGGMVTTWFAFLSLPSDVVAANDWVDDHQDALIQALQFDPQTAVGYVQALTPAKLDSEGANAPVLMITLRTV